MQKDFCNKDLNEVKLMDIFNRIGVTISNKKENLIVDSLVFVNLIVEIEELFSIDIEVEMLDKDRLNSFEDYLKMVEKCLDPD